MTKKVILYAFRFEIWISILGKNIFVYARFNGFILVNIKTIFSNFELVNFWSPFILCNNIMSALAGMLVEYLQWDVNDNNLRPNNFRFSSFWDWSGFNLKWFFPLEFQFRISYESSLKFRNESRLLTSNVKYIAGISLYNRKKPSKRLVCKTLTSSIYYFLNVRYTHKIYIG